MAKRSTSCDMLIERLSAFLDGDLGAAECGRIARHARSCPRCTVLTAELQRTVGLCRRAANAPLPPAQRRRARASILKLLKERS
jgi:anti-sigma factor RsiW